MEAIGKEEKANLVQKCHDNCNKIEFSYVCNICESFLGATGSEAKLDFLFNDELAQRIGQQSLYPMIRLILPACDKREAYGWKQKSICDFYIQFNQLDEQSDDAIILRNWDKPIRWPGGNTGKVVVELPSIIANVMKDRAATKNSGVTIGRVNELLDEITLAKNDKKKTIFENLVKDFSVLEHKWIVAIILGEMKHSVTHKALLNRFDPNHASIGIYETCGNLQQALEFDRSKSKQKLDINLKDKFGPQLAGFNAKHTNQVLYVEDKLSKKPFVMDVKLDGERMLFYIEKDNELPYKLYTRNGTDYTDNYKHLGYTVALNTNIKKCIYDGEVCAWDKHANFFVPFSKNRTVASEELNEINDRFDLGDVRGGKNVLDWRSNLSQWLYYIPFDIVYIEDNESSVQLIIDSFKKAIQDGFACELPETISAGDISYVPLVVRRHILKVVMSPIDHVFEIVHHKICADVTNKDNRIKEIDNYFSEQITWHQQEGLVVKNLLSSYTRGDSSRHTGGWYKLKPDYSHDSPSFEVVILGANPGTGKGHRAQGMSTFTCGVKANNDSNCTIYRIFCRVGTGYNENDLEKLRDKLNGVLFPVDEDKSNLPEYLKEDFESLSVDNRPVFCAPHDKIKDSVVLEIKCAEIIGSNSTFGLTTRFPRCINIRYDKNVDEIASVQDIEDMKKRPKVVTSGLSESSKPFNKKRKAAQVTKKNNSKASDPLFVSQSTTNIDIDNGEESFYENEIFHVSPFMSYRYVDESGIESIYEKADVEAMITKRGGKVVANPNERTSMVLGWGGWGAMKGSVQMQQFILSGKYSVVDPSYVIDCFRANKKLPLKSSYFYSMSPTDVVRFDNRLDYLGFDVADTVESVTEMNRIILSVDTKLEVLTRNYEGSTQNSKPRSKKSKQESTTVNTTFSAEQMTEISNLLSMKNVINDKKMEWRQIADKLDSNDTRVILSSYPCWHSGVLLYVDIFEDLGDRSNTQLLGPDDILHHYPMSAVAMCLLSQGAVISRYLHDHVTHIVVSEEDPSRIQLILNRLSEIRTTNTFSYDKKICSKSWAEKCLDVGYYEPTALDNYFNNIQRTNSKM